MVGLHPGSVGADVEEELSAIKKVLYAHREQCVAVGEIGMDLYWDKTFIKEQEHAFREQIRWAKELQLPIAIHARDAFDEIFSVLDEVNDNQLTGTHEHAQHILSYGGFKLGIGGVVTYKTSELPEVLTHIDLKHIILETDSPYLPPVPYRGKRNESAYLLHIAEKLTEIYGMPLKEIADATTLNAKELKKILAHKLKTKEIELQMQKEVLNTVIETQEEERRRISRDLHDDISSKLNAVSMNLHLLKRSNLSEANREELADNMLEACDLVMKSARQIAHNLTPSTLENIGLHSSIQELCKEMSSGPVRIQYENPKGQSYFDFLNLEQHIHLFRIIQELINNSIRHGKAMEITLSLMSGQQHKMIYTDNGSGILLLY
ncbi:hydrolase, TatD family, partial [Ancylostoma ceylanicum]